MKGAYELLFASVGMNLRMPRSLIVTATFSRTSYWKNFFATFSCPAPHLKIIWCRPQNDSDEEIQRRLDGRQFGINCWSSVNSLERYHEVKNRYETIKLPHLELDTSPPHTVDESAEKALAYILV